MSEQEKEVDFEKLLDKRKKDDFITIESSGGSADDRLKEISKKLPSWSLEPPFSFLK